MPRKCKFLICFGQSEPRPDEEESDMTSNKDSRACACNHLYLPDYTKPFKIINNPVQYASDYQPSKSKYKKKCFCKDGKKSVKFQQIDLDSEPSLSFNRPIVNGVIGFPKEIMGTTSTQKLSLETPRTPSNVATTVSPMTYPYGRNYKRYGFTIINRVRENGPTIEKPIYPIIERISINKRPYVQPISGYMGEDSISMESPLGKVRPTKSYDREINQVQVSYGYPVIGKKFQPVFNTNQNGVLNTEHRANGESYGPIGRDMELKLFTRQKDDPKVRNEDVRQFMEETKATNEYSVNEDAVENSYEHSNNGETFQIRKITRDKRETEIEKSDGVKLNLEEPPKDIVEAVVSQTENIVAHNKNKSAAALEKIGTGLGIASQVVKQVGDQVGSTIGGQMAQFVLNQVSGGLAIASNAAQTIAEQKRSGRKRRWIESGQDYGYLKHERQQRSLIGYDFSSGETRGRKNPSIKEVGVTNFELNLKKRNKRFLNGITKDERIVLGRNKRSVKNDVRDSIETMERKAEANAESQSNEVDIKPKLAADNIIRITNKTKDIENIVNILVQTLGEGFRNCIVDVIVNGNYKRSNDGLLRSFNSTVFRDKLRRVGAVISGTLNTSAGIVDSFGPAVIGLIGSRVIACSLQKAGKAVTQIYGNK